MTEVYFSHGFFYFCNMNVLFISGAEIFFVVFVSVLIFGSDKLPEIVRGLAKGMRQLKDATEDIKREIKKTADNQGLDTNLGQEIKKEFNEVKKSVEDVGGSIKRGGM